MPEKVVEESNDEAVSPHISPRNTVPDNAVMTNQSLEVSNEEEILEI